jgi:putative transcriptional regulator
MPEMQSLSGKFLIAMPGIGDPRFEKSVVLLCMHSPAAAMGVIVNKPNKEVTIKDVLGHLGIEAKGRAPARPVLDGGPVKPDRGFVLHSDDFDAGPATQNVAPGMRLTATREVIDALAGKAAPRDYALALGYAGWGPGQLENELAQNVWLVGEPQHAIVYGRRHSEKWAEAIRDIGFDPVQLTGEAGTA